MVSPSLDASSVLPLPIAREPCGPSVRAGRVRGADVALAWDGSARLVDEGAIRLDAGQDARGHEVTDLGTEHPVRLHCD